MDENRAGPVRGTFWITGLTTQERSALIATFGGWMLDGMDVMVYSFVIPALILQWHLTQGQAGLLGTATLLISAAGGWLAGIAADRYGRTRVLQVTIFWFAFFTFLSGFAHSYWQLLITRGLQGLGFGGEWAVGSVLMGGSDSTAASRQSGGNGAERLGDRLGDGCDQLYRAVFFSSFGTGMARDVLDRHLARVVSGLHPGARSGARSVEADARASATVGREASVS